MQMYVCTHCTYAFLQLPAEMFSCYFSKVIFIYNPEHRQRQLFLEISCFHFPLLSVAQFPGAREAPGTGQQLKISKSDQ